jgi:hypothetical protein
MNWTVALVVGAIAIFLLYETRDSTGIESFVAPVRSDIGYAADGWTEDSGYDRDLRYAETFADVQGRGYATDFCRAVQQKGDPGSLMMACALGTRDGMNTMEYHGKSLRSGFRFSRDDYWRVNKTHHSRMDYCRILLDKDTNEWYASCAIAGRDGFKSLEERDTNPPPAINQLLEAYDGILTWFRWHDDGNDYSQNAEVQLYGRPIVPSALKAIVSRGLELNRWPIGAQQSAQPAPPPRDYGRWGEHDTLELSQTIQPRQIRSIACWVYWDAFEKGAKIVEASEDGRKGRMWLGIEGGGLDLPSPRVATPATEVHPEQLLAVGQVTEPALAFPSSVSNIPQPEPDRSSVVPTGRLSDASLSATYVFEIWDDEQRIMRVAAPMGSAQTGRWQHVAVTTTDATAWWPTWQLWIDGSLVATRTDGRLSPALTLKQNYIGRGLRGCLQDFRIYSKPLPSDKLQAAINWGRTKLHPNP